VAGRNFYPEEDEIENSQVVILSHKLWKSRYNLSDAIIGDAITLDGDSFTVVGVADSEFKFLEVGDVDIWLPAATREWADNRGSGWLRCFGRLKDGVSYERVNGNECHPRRNGRNLP
jgi:putative ABC transport system permease protein